MISTMSGAKLLALSACMFSSVMGATTFGNSSSPFIPGRYLVEFQNSTTVSLKEKWIQSSILGPTNHALTDFSFIFFDTCWQLYCGYTTHKSRLHVIQRGIFQSRKWRGWKYEFAENTVFTLCEECAPSSRLLNPEDIWTYRERISSTVYNFGVEVVGYYFRHF